ncbi:MAG: preprotein translocase subunit YajC [Thermoanaerobaculia bacterium]|nr:preprotein translocase subunit YajC [Thermoanaerobaculia bacterium]
MIQLWYPFLAQANGGAAPPAWMQFVPMLLILLVFYFLLVAPMRKRQKELKAKVEALEKGDRVITSGGLHGEVAGIETANVFLKIAKGVRVKVSKSAINQIEDEGDEE